MLASLLPVTTFVANEQPELLLDVAVVLDHGPTVVLEYYNLAKSLSAGRRHNVRVEQMTSEAELAGLDYLDRHRPRPRPANPQGHYRQPGAATLGEPFPPMSKDAP